MPVVQVELPEEILDALDRLAFERGVDRDAVIALACEDWVDAQPVPAGPPLPREALALLAELEMTARDLDDVLAATGLTRDDLSGWEEALRHGGG